MSDFRSYRPAKIEKQKSLCVTPAVPIITKDQYAWYEGDPARAGFLSNYIYGYAAAHAFGHPIVMHGAGQVAGFQIPTIEEILRWQFKSDNPEDIKAYVQGWKDYLSEMDERYYLERIRQRQTER